MTSSFPLEAALKIDNLGERELCEGWKRPGDGHEEENHEEDTYVMFILRTGL